MRVSSPGLSILDWIVVFAFGITAFSIPAFSFAPSCPLVCYILTGILVFFSLIKVFLSKEVFCDSTVVLFLLFLLVALLGYAVNGFRRFSLSVFLNTAVLIVGYLFCANSKTIVIKRLLFSFVIGLLAFGLFFFCCYAKTIISSNVQRLGAEFGDVNDIGIILSTGGCYSLILASSLKKKAFLALGVLSFIFMCSLSLCTGSKICVLICFVFVVFLIILSFAKKRIVLGLVFVFLLVLFFSLFFVLPFFAGSRQRFFAMFKSVFDENSRGLDSFTDRLGMFRNGISLFLRNPLLGLGGSGFDVYSTYHSGWSHNHVSETLCNFGILGTAAYHVPLIKNANKKNIYFYVPYVVASLSVALFTEKIFTYIFGIILALGCTPREDALNSELSEDAVGKMKDTNQNKEVIMVGPKAIPSREGGIDVVVEKLSKGLAALGFQITAFVRRKVDKTKELPFAVKRVFTVNRKATDAIIYSFLSSLIALFSRAKIVHFHAEGNCLFLWLFRFSKKKIIVTIHGLDWKRAKFRGLGRKVLLASERQIVKYSDEIITLCQSDHQYFLEKYGRETTIIPNGFERWDLVPPQLITEKYGLCGEDYILFLARIVPEKGLHYLIRAFMETDINMKLIVAGSDAHSRDYYESIKKEAHDSRIIFTGFVEGRILQELFSNAYLYVLPSDIEGMPMSLLEALGHQRICLTSNIPENHVDDVNQYFFEKGNVSDLKRSLLRITVQKKGFVENPNLISWDEVVVKTAAVYDRILNGNKT